MYEISTCCGYVSYNSVTHTVASVVHDDVNKKYRILGVWKTLGTNFAFIR